jgi:hypothetical protein
MKEDELGGLCSTHGKLRNTYKICSEALKGRKHVEDKIVDGKITLEWILGIKGGKV